MRIARSFAFAALLAGVAATACKQGFLEVQNEQDILDVNLDNPDAIAPLLPESPATTRSHMQTRSTSSVCLAVS